MKGRRRTYAEELEGHTVLVSIAHDVFESGSWLGGDYVFCLEVFACKERPRLVYALRQILTLFVKNERLAI